jgi:hypothetical protein
LRPPVEIGVIIAHRAPPPWCSMPAASASWAASETPSRGSSVLTRI